MPTDLIVQNTHVETNQGKLIKHDGRSFYVVPVVALVAGVVNGELAPASEIGKYPDAWAGITIPLGHPRDGSGQPITANSPDLISHALGRFWNPTFVGDRLKGEIWLDVERIEKQGGQAAKTYKAIKAGRLHEVSTAYFRDVLPQQGTYNGKPYNGVQVNLRPDHLAILPDQIGACSITDGCGVPRTNQKDLIMKNTINLPKFPGIAAIKDWLFSLSPGWSTNESINKRLDKIRRAFIEANTAPNEEVLVWPADVYDDLVIGRKGANEYWAYNFTENEEGDIEFAPPYEVTKNELITYSRKDNGEMVANTDQPCFIGSFELIENEDQTGNPHNEEIEEMSTQTANQNTAQAAQETPQETPQAAVTTNASTITQQTEQSPPAAENKANGLISLEAAGALFDRKLADLFKPYGGIDNALITLQQSHDQRESQKTLLIKAIAANDRNTLPEETLSTLSVEVLRGIGKSLQPVSYAGQAPIMTNTGDPGDSGFMPMPSVLDTDYGKQA